MTGLLDLLIMIGIFSLITLGLDFVVGYAKIFSVNQGLIFATGAFSYVFATQFLHITDLFFAWVIAVVSACAISALIGLASLRVRGDAFIVISFGAQTIGMEVIYNWSQLSGGDSGVFGLPSPTVGAISIQSQVQFLIVIVIVTLVAYLLTGVIVRSPWGRLLRAAGEDDVATAAGGFDPRKLKVVAFVLGGAYAAIAGPLYVAYVGTAQVNDFSLDISISLLAMVILGGAGRLLGGLIGAIIYQLVPFLLDFANLPGAAAGYINQGIFGLALLAVVLFVPSGLTGGVAERIKMSRERKRMQTENARVAEKVASVSHGDPA